MQSPGNWQSLRWWVVDMRGQSIADEIARASASPHGLAGWAERHWQAVNPSRDAYAEGSRQGLLTGREWGPGLLCHEDGSPVSIPPGTRVRILIEDDIALRHAEAAERLVVAYLGDEPWPPQP